MNILEAVNKDKFRDSVISFSGGGGKSTLMYRSALELSSSGLKVLVTTTTMIYHPDVMNRPYNGIIIGSIGELARNRRSIKEGTITVAAYKTLEADGKTKLNGFSPAEIERVLKAGIFDAVLVEADGAKHLPIKAPGENEPVIPARSSIVFGVIGMEAINSRISDDIVFRTDIFTEVTGTKRGDRINRDVILKLVSSENGLFKNTPYRAERILVINKTDNAALEETAGDIGRYILNNNREISGVLLTSLIKDNPVLRMLKRTIE